MSAFDGMDPKVRRQNSIIGATMIVAGVVAAILMCLVLA